MALLWMARPRGHAGRRAAAGGTGRPASIAARAGPGRRYSGPVMRGPPGGTITWLGGAAESPIQGVNRFGSPLQMNCITWRPDAAARAAPPVTPLARAT